MKVLNIDTNVRPNKIIKSRSAKRIKSSDILNLQGEKNLWLIYKINILL